ncbi:MAG: family 78 glycoside hydrolase catalytic domain, partial [Clostridiales bacterium]|nr:family 78 glycoside hydrolase catalytic domain [Clostridiales bacterium]
MRRGRKILSLILALTLLMGIALQSGVSAFAEGASGSVIVGLQTDYTTNPIGSDASNPTFSWQMQSNARGQLQSAYQVMVSSSAEKLAAGDYDMWDSGKVESGIAVDIPYEGNPLQATTRYFWQVKVWDQDGNTAVSTEEAYFETGLMDSGWDNAKWIMVNKDAEGTEEGGGVNNFSIDFDMVIDSDNAGICFGAADKKNYFMWQISTLEGKKDDTVLVRPHVKTNDSWAQYPGHNGGVAYDVTSAIGYKASELIGKEIHVRIVIRNGKTIDTYFNGSETSAFTYNIPTNLTGAFSLGKVMFRHQTDKGCQEITRYDNFIVKDGEDNILFEEHFDNPADTGFDGGEVVDGWLRIGETQTGGVDKETLVIQTRENKDYSGVDKNAFTMDFDFIIDNDNAGICFGATDTNNFYLYQINAHNSISAELSETTGCLDESAGTEYNHIYIRPHVQRNGGWSVLPSAANTTDVTEAIGYTAKEILGKKIHCQIVSENGIVKTYFGEGENKKLAATNDFGSPVPLGKIMFRHSSDKNARELARYDNFVVKNYQGKVVFEDDFSNANNPNFTGGTIVDGMLEIGSTDPTAGEKRIIQKDPAEGTSAPMFRKEFNTTSNIASAKLYASAAGIYEVYLNGAKVSGDYFNPGWTDYMKNTMYQTFDVTNMVIENGANAIGAMLGEGWYSGNITHVGADRYGKELAFIAKLVITYADGTQSTIVTDDSWTVNTTGPIIDNNFLNGEKYDARKEIADWDKAGFAADNSWRKVKTVDSVQNIGKLISQIGPTVTQVDTVKPVSVNKVTRADGKEVFIYDFGQNFAGIVSLKNLKGEAGSTISLRHGEMLNDAPKGTRGCDDNEGTLYDANLRTFKAIDTYTLKGDENGESYTPRFTFHGFRYLEISGITEPIPLEDVTGIVLSSDAEWASSYETSNELVNRLYLNVIWGQRSNFLSIPTDCPQRNERMGWTGDAQIFTRTGTYNMNANQFYAKYLNDVRTSQRSDGQISHVAPALNVYESYSDNGWGDAITIMPWQIYQQYGDTSIIRENYAAAKKWVSFMEKNSTNYVRPGGSLGDWLSINSSTPTTVTDTAFFAYSADLMSKMAAVIGEDADAAYYADLSQKVKAAWRGRFMKEDGSLTVDTQTAYLVALNFDLVLPDQRANIARLLVENIKEHGYHLTVGFVGVSYLCPVLSDMGYDDVAYKLLEQETYPGWLYSVLQGATTIWERWNSYTLDTGFGDVSMNSFNHYSYGSIQEWMMRYSLGIERDEAQPGYKHIILQPTFGGTLTYAKGHYDSVYGRISSGWTLNGKDFTYDVTIPANTTATLYLPTETTDVFESGKALAEAEGIQVIGEKNGKLVMELGSGTYSFSTKVDPTVKERYGLAIANPYNIDATATINGDNYSLPTSVLTQEGEKEIKVVSNDPNYAFAYWGKDIYDSNPNRTVNLDSDMSLTAYFKYVANAAAEGAETATLNLNGEEGTVIQVNGETVTLPYSGSFAIGTEVTIDVKAPANRFFD